MPGWEESYVRKSEVLLLEVQIWQSIFNHCTGNHQLRTQLFMPEVSLAIDYTKQLVDDEEIKKADQKLAMTEKPTYTPIHVVSDGTTAYVKRLD